MAYSYGFTEFKPISYEEEMDDFERWARDISKAAGIVDPEPEVKYHEGQILASFTLVIPAPKKHGVLYGITE
jgi:hypothetical protein